MYAGDYNPDEQAGDKERTIYITTGFTRTDVALSVIFSLLAGVVLDRLIQSQFCRTWARWFKSLVRRDPFASHEMNDAGGSSSSSSSKPRMKLPRQHAADEDDDEISMRDDL